MSLHPSYTLYTIYTIYTLYTIYTVHTIPHYTNYKRPITEQSSTSLSLLLAFNSLHISGTLLNYIFHGHTLSKEVDEFTFGRDKVQYNGMVNQIIVFIIFMLVRFAKIYSVCFRCL